MKIYRTNYNTSKNICCGEHIVCESEEDITDILAQRHNTTKDNIEKLEFYEVSKERVYIKDLTAGDLLRLINGEVK